MQQIFCNNPAISPCVPDILINQVVLWEIIIYVCLIRAICNVSRIQCLQFAYFIKGGSLATEIAIRHQDTIFHSINEGVFSVDLSWRITSFNRAAEKTTQVKGNDAVGRACREVFRASICENACALKRSLLAGKPMFNVTTCIVTQSGIQIPIRLSTAPLKEREGTVVGGVETFQALTQVEQLRKEDRTSGRSSIDQGRCTCGGRH
jgi:PAS domain S-box-containing protein